jgi:hypothetical protein
VRRLLDSLNTTNLHQPLRDVIALSSQDPIRQIARLLYASKIMDGPIASAVVLPEELLAPASPHANKRRQASISEQTAKRPRLDDDAANGRRESNTEASPAVPVRRERGRERRLFGAVLGALSQAPSTTAAQKRRSEIEKRQLAQRKQENEESEQRKAERMARRKAQRWKEQKRFEAQSVSGHSVAYDSCVLTIARCD